MPILTCPACAARIKASDRAVGRPVVCPKCSSNFVVSIAEATPPPPVRSSRVPEVALPLPELQAPSDSQSPPAREASPDQAASAAAEPQAQPIAARRDGEKYCHECGAVIRARAAICPKCGVPQPSTNTSSSYLDTYPGSKRLEAGLFALLLGCLGIHKFVLGHQTAGTIMLVASIMGPLCGFFSTAVMAGVGVIEGILYLSKTDEQFYNVYQLNKRPWF
jgi:TM2 domain-containing membrane protein YozV